MGNNPILYPTGRLLVRQVRQKEDRGNSRAKSIARRMFPTNFRVPLLIDRTRVKIEFVRGKDERWKMATVTKFQERAQGTLRLIDEAEKPVQDIRKGVITGDHG